MADDVAAAAAPISIIGMMGAGKSTVAQALARRLGWAWRDLDQEIVAASGAEDVSAIFAKRGEEGFRALERSVLETTLRGAQWCVIAMGGGTPAQGDAMDLIRAAGPSVWLRVPVDVAARRAFEQGGRPLLATCQGAVEAAERLTALAQAREPYYARAEIIVDVADDSPDVIASRILDAIRQREVWA